MNRRVWQSICKSLSLALAFIFAITLINPISATAKTKTLNLKVDYTTDPYVDYVDSVSTNITKTGTYKVVQKKHDGVYVGYIRFVAPKTKKYTITVSNLKCKGNEQVYGGVQLYTPANDGTDSVRGIMCVTKGKEDSVLQLAHKKMGSNLIPKRSGKITLNEGQILYLHYQFIVKTKGKKLTSKLVIK